MTEAANGPARAVVMLTTHIPHFELLPGVLNENPSPLPGEGPLRPWFKLFASPPKNVWN